MIPIAAEASGVQQDQEIAVLYTAGYSPKDLANLMTLQQTIKDYQTNNILRSVVDRDLDAIELEISVRLQRISEAMSAKDFDSLLDMEGALKGAMEKRRQYMNTTIQADSHLETLYQQERNLQNRIDANRIVLTTPQEGILSYFTDGYEAVLRPENMDEFTVSNTQELMDGIEASGLISGTDTTFGNTPVFRIVQPAPWYLLAILPRTDAAFAPGSVCEVTVDGYEGTVPAYVVDVRTEKKRSLVILEIRNAVESALSLRRATVSIRHGAEGLMVPRNYLGSDEQGYYLRIRSQSGEKQKVYVRLLGADDRNVVVEGSDKDGLKTGMRLYRP
jgi:putative membrane fusion protein